MMEQFAERLKAVREAFGLSQRRFSTELGLSHHAWPSYESGSSLPGTPVMDALARRGINLNWLVTGKGSMWVEADAVDMGVTGLIEQAEQRHADKLGLGRMSLLARRSHIRVRNRVLLAIAGKYPHSVTLQDLAQIVGMTSEDVAAYVLDLIEHGVVARELRNGVESYASVTPSLFNITKDAGDQAQITLAAIRFIAAEAVPNATKDPASAVFVHANATVAKGKGGELMSQILEAAKQICASLHAPDGEAVEFVIAASKKGCGTELAEE